MEKDQSNLSMVQNQHYQTESQDAKHDTSELKMNNKSSLERRNPNSAGSEDQPLPYTIKTVLNKGRGLFATKDLPMGFHIHTAPCILVTQKEYEDHMKFTVLEHYLFNCQDGDRLLALGYGSLFNHDSKRPNVSYELDKENLQIHYTVGHYGAKKGEELCIYYGDNLWFDDKESKDEGSESSSDEEDNALGSFLGKMEL